jgi:hemoglobin/transferrin/lactoferrin receptor protein
LSYHPAGVTETHALFAQNEFIWNDQLTIIAGARLDRQQMTPAVSTGITQSTDTTATAFTLAAHYQFTDQFALFGSASYTERLPTIDEMFDTRNQPTPALGTLRPEESINYEIGAALSFEDVFAGGDQLSVKGVLFDNHMFDQIATNGAGVMVGGITPSYINLNETRIQGFELEASYEADRFFGSLAYTRLLGENIGNPAATNPNLENQIPADTAALTLGYRSFDQAWEFGWTGTWADAATRWQAGMGGVTAINSPSYFIHDLYAVWRPQAGILEGTEFRLGIENVTDETYRTHLQSTGTYRAGRTASLTLTRTF